MVAQVDNYGDHPPSHDTIYYLKADQVWSIQYVKPLKLRLQFSALCGAVCILSIGNITFTSSSIVSLLNLFMDFSFF